MEAPIQYPNVIYGAIKEGKYAEAIELLTAELANFPRSRAALSLLGYCYYQVADFNAASEIYETLVSVCPDVEGIVVHIPLLTLLLTYFLLS